MLEVTFTYKFLNKEKEEIFSALLNTLGFEGIWYEHNTMKAYIEKQYFSIEKLEQVINNLAIPVHFIISEIAETNWNNIWESSYQPVLIANKLLIKAPFHKIDNSYPIEIIIQPQMSFGTGHHPTTYLIAEYLLTINLKEKIVIDAGCGTGILSILAEKLGASAIYAFDIEKNAVENTKQNILLNQCVNIYASLNSVKTFSPVSADIFIANINRNVLIDEMDYYAKLLKQNGELILSGFLTEDVNLIIQKATNIGLKYRCQLQKNDWHGLVFIK
ncbi:MAG: 50S ribosomal protein L11 methyltransferase [Bacteroidales bacterium]|nr:50S ribosomal protein L11 methyltransferase [Bacteroidales bacterium]